MTVWDASMTFDPKAWLWFLSSYALLWIMLGLRFDPLWLRVGLIVFGLACVAYVAFVLARAAGELPSNTTLTIVGNAGAEVSGYLAAYLLPFLTVANPSARDCVAYALFFVVAGLVYVRSGLMQINPTVYLMNRKVLRATIPVQGMTKEVFVIARRDLRVATPVNAERISDRVYVDHGGW
jgi:hypothetical protein